jgi:hypothetical protein
MYSNAKEKLKGKNFCKINIFSSFLFLVLDPNPKTSHLIRIHHNPVLNLLKRLNCHEQKSLSSDATDIRYPALPVLDTRLDICYPAKSVSGCTGYPAFIKIRYPAGYRT